MEYIVVLAVVMVLILILGQSFMPLMVAVLGLMELFALLCTLFFVISALVLLFTKRKAANYLALEKDERGIHYAFYEIAGEEYKNTFPTDGIMKKLLYREGPTYVRVLKMNDLTLVFDKVSQAVIWLGLPIFALISVAIYLLMIMA